MIRLVTLLALVAIIFTATGLHKLGGEAHAAQTAHTIELTKSAEKDCCADAKKNSHSSCIAPYIVASSIGHCLSNHQNSIFVFLDDHNFTSATASPLKRPPRLIL